MALTIIVRMGSKVRQAVISALSTVLAICRGRLSALRTVPLGIDKKGP